MTTRLPRTFSLLTTLLILTLGWFAVPYASQKGANDGFILFSTDRDHPSEDVLCPGCEAIYVMLPVAPIQPASPTTPSITKRLPGRTAKRPGANGRPGRECRMGAHAPYRIPE